MQHISVLSYVMHNCRKAVRLVTKLTNTTPAENLSVANFHTYRSTPYQSPIKLLTINRLFVLLRTCLAAVWRRFYHRLVLLLARPGLAGGAIERFTGLPFALFDAGRYCDAWPILPKSWKMSMASSLPSLGRSTPNSS